MHGFEVWRLAEQRFARDLHHLCDVRRGLEVYLRLGFSTDCELLRTEAGPPLPGFQLVEHVVVVRDDVGRNARYLATGEGVLRVCTHRIRFISSTDAQVRPARVFNALPVTFTHRAPSRVVILLHDVVQKDGILEVPRCVLPDRELHVRVGCHLFVALQVLQLFRQTLLVKHGVQRGAPGAVVAG